jgi:hypothetical protein
MTVQPTEQSPRILKLSHYGQAMQTTLGAMIMHREAGNRYMNESGYTVRRVMGYKLPEWQRDSVWNDAKCIRFIESIYLGVALGTFMVNMSFSSKAIDLILLDGQQRLRAIERYIDSDFAVPGVVGAYLWHELDAEERAHFTRICFPWVETVYDSEVAAIEAYQRHNFGGIHHDASDAKMVDCMLAAARKTDQ